MSASGGGRLPTFSPLAIDLRAALSPRALTRARYGGAALGLPSRASSCPCSDQTMALSARARGAYCRCGGEGADAARRAAQPAPNVEPRPAA